MADTSWCKKCGAKIYWQTVAKSGKRIPLDTEAHPDGTVRVDSVRNVVSIVQRGSHKPLYRTHFDACGGVRG